MSNNEKYVVTGRYMNGTEVSGYHIISSLGANQKKVTREQLVYLLGKGEIANCTGQLYGDQVIIRGTNGVSIADLPIFDERSKSMRQTEFKSNVKPKDGNMSKILGQLTLTARLMCGKESIGYEVKNYGGQVRRLSRDQVMELASDKQISNATVQNLSKDGTTVKLLRGAGVSLNSLPTIMVDKRGNNIEM